MVKSAGSLLLVYTRPYAKKNPTTKPKTISLHYTDFSDTAMPTLPLSGDAAYTIEGVLLPVQLNDLLE